MTDPLRPLTQQRKAVFKDLVATKADGVVALRRKRLNQKSVLEHTTQTTTECKQPSVFCTCVGGINCLYQHLSVVYIRHLKGEAETRIYDIYQDT